MFGYVRPLKTELLVRELTRYRAVYCGICKEIGRDYGQLPRLTVGYDLTMLALLLLSLSPEQPPVEDAACIANPFLKKPIVTGSPIINRCAALTVLLAYQKAKDNITDNATITSKAVRILLKPGYRKARKQYPEDDVMIRKHLGRLSELEKGKPDPSAARVFGDLLAGLMQKALTDSKSEPRIQDALILFAEQIGIWIYLCDAIDDYDRDCNNGNWNPFSDQTPEEAKRIAGSLLEAAEIDMDRIAALLPYERDAGIMANIVTQGLPSVRMTVLAGKRLGRL
jgi:hypothetical protein